MSRKKRKVKSQPITSFLQSTTSSSISSDSVFQSSIIKDAVPMLSSLTEMITTESSPISSPISESTSTQSTKSTERPLNSGSQSQVETLQPNAKSVPTLSICDFSLKGSLEMQLLLLFQFLENFHVMLTSSLLIRVVKKKREICT